MKYSAVLCTILLLEIFGAWSPAADAKKFMRCELAKELLQKYQFDKTLLSNWICLVEHESDLNTSKVTRKQNGSVNYGLFQISSKEWCRADRKAGRCNKKCDDFADDNIADDIECAKQIFNTYGFKYWPGWNQYCYRNSNLPNLELLCKLNKL